jgi:hypothetical protein
MTDSTDDRQQPGTSAKPGAPKVARTSSKSTAAEERDRKSRTTPVKLDSPRWLAPTMITMFILGLIWIVAYYVAPDAPFISTLGYWNVVVGFGLFGVGFFLSTKWR